MSTPALRHFLAHAVETHGPGLDRAFPGCFDWRRLCRDTPVMLERATRGAFDTSDAARVHLIQERAEAIFRTAHVATLAVRSAMDAGDVDPDALLDGLATPPDEDEEDRFEARVVDSLDAVESSFEDDEVELDRGGLEIRNLVAVTWAPVHELLEENEALEPVPDSDHADAIRAARPVLLALIRVAAILAAIRWLARYPGHDEHAG